tara:strand:+ start:1724 stop:2029 length:306 start_codon:yes stop_codon:yes gene_type:complete
MPFFARLADGRTLGVAPNYPRFSQSTQNQRLIFPSILNENMVGRVRNKRNPDLLQATMDFLNSCHGEFAWDNAADEGDRNPANCFMFVIGSVIMATRKGTA